eukprot:scaffold7504_cov277-Pinguiococcus_pyrenoidosus.AAC.4
MEAQRCSWLELWTTANHLTIFWCRSLRGCLGIVTFFVSFSFPAVFFFSFFPWQRNFHDLQRVQHTLLVRFFSCFFFFLFFFSFLFCCAGNVKVSLPRRDSDIEEGRDASAIRCRALADRAGTERSTADRISKLRKARDVPPGVDVVDVRKPVRST